MSVKKPLLFVLSIAALGCISHVTAKTGPSHGKIVVCYISTWAVYRPGRGAYSIENFDANLCTHAVYAFAGLDITQAAIKSLDPWQDLKEEYGKGGYERLTGLKRSHPHLKVNLAIGGWNEGSKNYSMLVADVEQRRKFVKQVTGFVRKYNFDGLDLDWEYPTQRGGMKQDRENFVELAKEFREEFNRYNLLLTSAIGASKNVIDQAYDVRQLSRYLDFLHIMCYDYHGSWDKAIGYNAPLTAPNGDTLSVQFTIDYLLKLGAPNDKLVLGLPFYGRSFITPFEGNLGDSAEGKAMQGPYTREEGFLGYNEICNILRNKSSGWTTAWDGLTSQMIARSPRDTFTGTTYVVTYDSARSIANKVRFAIRKNLAGLMVWSVDTDDFNDDCAADIYSDTYTDFDISRGNSAPTQHLHLNYPLLRTINEAVILSQEEYRHHYEHHDDQPNDHNGNENDISSNEIITENRSKNSNASSMNFISTYVFVVVILRSFAALFLN